MRSFEPIAHAKKHFYINALLLLILLLTGSPVKSQLAFDKEEYAARREKLMTQIPNGILVMRGAGLQTGIKHFYQNNDVTYLTGVEVPHVMILMDGREKKTWLFMTMTEDHAKSEGYNLELVKDPAGVSGIEFVLPLEDFEKVLRDKIGDSTPIYAPHSAQELLAEVSREKRNFIKREMTEDKWDGRLSRNMQFVHQIKKRFPENEIRDCSPMIWDLRKIKSAAEIEMMREAGRIGVEAHKALMKASGDGVAEKPLAKLFECVCKNEGADDLAYGTIIMSGLNHAYGHCQKYDRTLANGDFVIVDAGPEIEHYDVDISTTFPANGVFTPKQKECYELALLVHQTCLKSYKPGITLADVGQKIKEALEANGYTEPNRRFAKWFKYGGYNHSVGMAVHDGMGTFDGTNEVLKPGFVFACDIMNRADSVTSVRIEDTVLITEDGCETLSPGLPRTVVEIEAFMGEE